MNEILNTLIRRSFAAGKVRNLIAVLAIALTTVLFTSVTTIGIGTSQSITLTMQMLKMSRSDGDFRNMTSEQFEALKKADFIKKAGLRMPVGFLTNASRHNVELDVADEIQAELTFCIPSHGSMPKVANEIVASDKAINALGADAEVGTEVTIEFSAHGKEYSIPMVVSGWYEAMNDQLSVMVVSTEFRDEYPEIFRYTYDTDSDIAGTYWSDFTADSTVNLQEKMNAFSRSVGGDPENTRASNYLPGIINTMTNQPVNLKVIAMAAVFIALFVFCGYLLIYNVFDIAVMQEIRRYGLYRTIGMSKRQVKKLINYQAVWLSLIGISIGLILGFLIGRIALPYVMNVFSGDYKNIAAEVSPSPVIFIAGAVLAAFTVFISTRKPVRVAANIPPIEAFGYVESGSGKRTERKSALGADIPRLAWSNLGRNKRRSFSIMVSLMLCIVLLNCVGTAAGSLDIEKQVDYMIRTDFVVVNEASTNMNKGFTLREQALKQQTINAIASQPGVSKAAAVYKNTREDTNVTYDFGIELLEEDSYIDENTGLRFKHTKDYEWFGLGTDQRPICNVYGMDKTGVSRMDLREGETDTEALYKKMQNGGGVIVGVSMDRRDMSVMEDGDFAQVGDVITVYKDGEPYMELPVLAKAALNGDDEETGYTGRSQYVIGGDGLFIYLPEEIYKKIYDEPVVYKYAFDVDEAYKKNMTEFLEGYMKTTDNSIDYLSDKSARESSEGMRIMINFVGSLVGVIFGISGVLNLINTIITTILTRRHEFATMQSIGMTKRQLTQMLVLEGIYYAAGSCIIGIVFSVIINQTLVKGLLKNMWQFTFKFTIQPALMACIVLLVISAAVPVIALKVFNKGSVVEQLRIAE